MEATEGTLLGGRLRYAQPRDGYRTGIEPVLLAACVPARAGQLVVEAGSGAGAGLMCLAARVPGVRGIGIELDPAMAGLARTNVAANGLAELDIVVGDVAGAALPSADHAMANPPWHDRRSTGSPVSRRRLALQEGEGGVEVWIAALAHSLAEGGSLTLVVAAGMVARCRVALEAEEMGRTIALWLRPKLGRSAKLAILQAWQGVGSSDQEIVLHEADGRYTAEIEAVLRGGAALPLDQGGENSRLPVP